MPKWLSYRDRAVLGRDLLVDEAVCVTDLTRWLAVLVALQPQLDAGYAAARDRAWKTTVAGLS
ncbi:MAG: hypothetical protein RKP20_01765 [Candidatus Competibacter sp.]|nr:hypothetical protein [Candidatus Competibacter sp.]